MSRRAFVPAASRPSHACEFPECSEASRAPAAARPRRSWLRACLLAVTALTLSPAFAAFPDKPIRVVIGFPAGGPLDQHARLLTERLQAVLGQPIIIDYKSGAGGTVGVGAER